MISLILGPVLIQVKPIGAVPIVGKQLLFHDYENLVGLDFHQFYGLTKR